MIRKARGAAQDVALPAHVSGGGGIGAYYVAGQADATALATAVLTFDRIQAIPFVVGRRCRLGEIACIVTGGVANAKGRLAVYRSTSPSNLYPGALLFGSAEIDFSTNAVKTAACSVQLNPRDVYWAAIRGGTASSTLRSLPVACAAPALGVPLAFGTAAQIGIEGASVYGAFPDPFPAGIGALVAAGHAIGLKFDA